MITSLIWTFDFTCQQQARELERLAGFEFPDHHAPSLANGFAAASACRLVPHPATSHRWDSLLAKVAPGAPEAAATPRSPCCAFGRVTRKAGEGKFNGAGVMTGTEMLLLASVVVVSLAVAANGVVPPSASASAGRSREQVLGADPHCATGLLSPGSLCCCAKECGECGGSSCQDRKGGRDSCCCGAISNSGRSCATVDPPCIVPASPPSPHPLPPVRPKRGFVADSHNCDDPLLLNTSGWFYGYNLADPYRAPGLPGNCSRANATGNLDVRFTPMEWCFSHGPDPPNVPAYVNQTYFMGYNEPNNKHNCNQEPRAVAERWGEIMQQFPQSQLVSPATSGDGVPWFDDFFSNCSALYGKDGCRISYLAAHCYSCNPNSTLAYLEMLHKRYDLKIWLTEFSCGDHAEGRSMADHLYYMEQVVPMLDAAPFIFRYAWMSAYDGSGLRGLVATETVGNVNRSVLTPVGRLYNSL